MWMRTRVSDDSDADHRELVVRARDWQKRFTLRAKDSVESDCARRSTVSSLRHDGTADDPEVAKHRSISLAEAAITVTLFLVAMILPHALIYALSRFHIGGSNAAQRAWMMAWLAADQLSSFRILVFWSIWKCRSTVIPVWVHYVSVAALLAPAVGGFMAMYLEDQGLGVCRA